MKTQSLKKIIRDEIKVLRSEITSPIPKSLINQLPKQLASRERLRNHKIRDPRIKNL